MDRKKELEKIAKEIESCRRCPLWQQATRAVPGEGDPEAEIMFIAEAPGFWEDKKGKPFVGQAGKLLDNLFSSVVLNREGVFITNILKHRPPGNRDPFPSEIDSCRGWLDRQIAIIQPRIIVTLGRFALKKFLPQAKITRLHGRSQIISFLGRRFLLFPLFHPATALRNGEILRSLRRDFQKIPSLLAMEEGERLRGQGKGEQLILSG